MITALILVPLVAAALIGVLSPRFSRALALVSTGLTAAVALLAWRAFDGANGGLQLVERHAWVASIGAEYLVGVDGLSLLLVLLTSIIFPFAFLAQPLPRGACALMLVMQGALYGTFTAQNFVLWFLFYELSLIPSFLLIKLWGGAKRDRAATKFFLYTFLGSVMMLLGFLGIYFANGTFDFAALTEAAPRGLLAGNLAWVAFLGIFLGLAVKVPLVPFHTWLPDAYEAAPTGVSMVLTGVLSKMGVYGFIRLLLPLFPEQIRVAGPWLLGLAVASILIGALAAWAQSDLKRMVGYLSISHLGYCMLGLCAIGSARIAPPLDLEAGLSGVFVQIFSHGITAAALFYYVGLLETRRGARGIGDFGGLMQRTPLLCGWMSVAMFSAIGLPGLNAFIGEFLIFKASFALARTYTAIAVLGLLFTAVALLRAMQALFSGPLPEHSRGLRDVSRGEAMVIVPVTLLMFAIGIAPQFVLNVVNAAVMQMSLLFTA